jgi:hypothetical protein
MQARGPHIDASGTPPPPPPSRSARLLDARAGPSLDSGDQKYKSDIQDAALAWKHCRNVVRDETSSRDLYDVLAHSVRESQYSTPSPTVSL